MREIIFFTPPSVGSELPMSRHGFENEEGLIQICPSVDPYLWPQGVVTDVGEVMTVDLGNTTITGRAYQARCNHCEFSEEMVFSGERRSLISLRSLQQPRHKTGT